MKRGPVPLQDTSQLEFHDLRRDVLCVSNVTSSQNTSVSKSYSEFRGISVATPSLRTKHVFLPSPFSKKRKSEASSPASIINISSDRSRLGIYELGDDDVVLVYSEAVRSLNLRPASTKKCQEESKFFSETTKRMQIKIALMTSCTFCDQI